MSTFAFSCFWFAKGDLATKGGEVMPGERVKKRKGERVRVGREGGRGGGEGYSKMPASAGKPV